ncbi:MAG: T9SS type A sorting domain-containing protein, partial [Calditrichaeota bacterium]|nr:T9SS type A sorting domain-containing protein [Calditrichota bacterium]
QFINTNVGFVSGSGTVLFTDNGGATWAVRGSGVSGETNGLYFTDESNGWVVNEMGQIFHTTNGGVTWATETTGTSGILNDVFIAANGAGWAVGDNGVILKHAPLTGIDDEPETAVRENKLAQNYPNPFNPATTIAFNLASYQKVQLTVYNIAGQQVAELINQPLIAGAHSVTFSGENLPSGVYFYELRASSFNEIKKMMLVK